MRREINNLFVGDFVDLRIQLSSVLILLACNLSGCDRSHEEAPPPLVSPIDKLISNEACKVHLESEKIFVNTMGSPDKETETFTLSFEFKGDSTVIMTSEGQVCLSKRDEPYCRIIPGSVTKLTYVKTQNLFLLMRGDHRTPWGYVDLKNEKEAELLPVGELVDWLVREKIIPLRIERCKISSK
jgi:hypothetical protein